MRNFDKVTDNIQIICQVYQLNIKVSDEINRTILIRKNDVKRYIQNKY